VTAPPYIGEVDRGPPALQHACPLPRCARAPGCVPALHTCLCSRSLATDHMPTRLSRLSPAARHRMVTRRTPPPPPPPTSGGDDSLSAHAVSCPSPFRAPHRSTAFYAALPLRPPLALRRFPPSVQSPPRPAHPHLLRLPSSTGRQPAPARAPLGSSPPCGPRPEGWCWCPSRSMPWSPRRCVRHTPS